MLRTIPLMTTVALLLVPGAAAAKSPDRDHDGLPDRWERVHKARSAKADHDHDRLSNLAEFQARTNPRRADSDRDGVRDGREDADRDGVSNAQEDRFGTHPRRRDSDGDGVRDGEEGAGRVTAVAGDLVTIGLASGGTLAGLVTGATELECEVQDDDADGPEARTAIEEPVELEDDSPEEADGAEPEDDSPEDENESEDADCAAPAIEVGALVKEAKVRLVGGQAVFEEIKLLS